MRRFEGRRKVGDAGPIRGAQRLREGRQDSAEASRDGVGGLDRPEHCRHLLDSLRARNER